MSKECSVFVNGAAIVFVPTGYGESKAKDLMDSILFSQLVANKKITKNPAASWSAEYIGVLDDFWVCSFKERQDIPFEKDCTATPFEWATMAMANGCKEDVRAMTESLEWVARLPCSSPEMGRLRNKVQQAADNAEALTPALPKSMRLLVVLAHEPASISCLCLEFKTPQALEGNPWTQRFHAETMDGPVSARYFRATLSETLYALYRDAIALKIRDRISDNVFSLAKAVDVSAGLPHGEVGS